MADRHLLHPSAKIFSLTHKTSVCPELVEGLHFFRSEERGFDNLGPNG